jgi:citrate lyase beta subunit
MTLDPELLRRLDAQLAEDDATRVARYPGPSPARQPVHTVYLPAERFTASSVDDWGSEALKVLDEHGPLPGFDAAIEARVRSKLSDEPIEDLRIDFEDGYGAPGDEREDRDVRIAATELATAIGDGRAPRAVGIRMKSLEGPTRLRGIRTLELFLGTLLARTDLPEGFRVTLPKVTSVAQVAVMEQLCGALDEAYRLPGLRFEIQVETPQAVLGADGVALVAPMLHAAAGRCVGLHYGTYDYSASVGIAAAYQSMEHPAADYAKAVMQVAAAGTGVPVSDGSTNVLPVGPREQVHEGWALHARLVRRSLERAFYQGWDLHPAQLPTRYAATFAFYRDGLPAAAARLRAYRERSSIGVLDEPATERALTDFLRRALDCGAADPDELPKL